MSPAFIGIIGIIILVLVLVSQMPVAFSLILIGLGGFIYLVSTSAGLTMAAKEIYESFSSYSLSVLPLFILMGAIAFNAGMSRKLYYTTHQWLGQLPGGLAIATIGGCAGFAAICGSSAATAATMSTVAIPEMKRYNYDPAFSTGSVAAGGTLGVLIPPSVVLIIYGIQTEQSIGRLFFAGILPGILQATLFIITIYVLASLRPHLGPRGPRTSLKQKFASLSGVFDMLLLFALVMGGLYAGWFTPTEAGGIGAIGALMIAFVRRDLTKEGFSTAITDTIRTTCMALLILTGAVIFGRFMTVSNIPLVLAAWVTELPLPNVAILIVVLLIYLLGGCFMDGLPFMMLTIPIFYPVALALDLDPIWFGIVITLMTEFGAITPPVGINVYVISGVDKDTPPETTFKGIVPFLLPLVACIALLVAFPQIALFLPSLIK